MERDADDYDDADDVDDDEVNNDYGLYGVDDEDDDDNDEEEAENGITRLAENLIVEKNLGLVGIDPSDAPSAQNDVDGPDDEDEDPDVNQLDFHKKVSNGRLPVIGIESRVQKVF